MQFAASRKLPFVQRWGGRQTCAQFGPSRAELRSQNYCPVTCRSFFPKAWHPRQCATVTDVTGWLADSCAGWEVEGGNGIWRRNASPPTADSGVTHAERVDGPLVFETGHFHAPDDGVDGLAGKRIWYAFIA